ncbi:hypothetical protein FOA52_008165 [Chlamydomonas sp. UWO 241]|nr:hypothetical protein FOA52_008165 [Chlamydomonas sp. UWO 241]
MNARIASTSTSTVRVAPARVCAASRCMPVARTTRVSVKAAAAAFAPPTLSFTKSAFLAGYPKPVNAVYNVVLQELLSSQHFMRHSKAYAYNEVFALGVVSVFEQVLETLPESERTAIFDAYLSALGDEAATYRADAAALEESTASLTGPLGIDGDAHVNKVLAKIKESTVLSKIKESTVGLRKGNFFASKFFSIGLFRLLEISGAKEPSALESLVKSLGAPGEAISKDLTSYRGVLTKLTSAKELMAEFVVREKKKQIERDADKAARAAKKAAEAEAEADSKAVATSSV